MEEKNEIPLPPVYILNGRKFRRYRDAVDFLEQLKNASAGVKLRYGPGRMDKLPNWPTLDPNAIEQG
jgi:acetyl esterase/lipase